MSYRVFRATARPPGQLRNHATFCSCPMCGNPRRHWSERTVQELRHLQDDE